MDNVLTVLKQKISVTHENKTCAGALVDTLINLGVDSIFGIPGASVLSIYNELSKKLSIKHYLMRHEQAAIHAAEGYSRTSGKVGVVLVTSGPGFTNTITGIANAYADSTPLVVLAGDIPSKNKSGKFFQNVDIAALTKSCSKKTYILSNPSNIKTVLEEAFWEANNGVKGPVVIVLPRNILESEYHQHICLNKPKIKLPINHNQQINKLYSMILNSQKPLVLVGGGCMDAAEEVTKFVSQINCPVVSTLIGIGVYPSNSSNYLGMVGINGTFKANAALNGCDLLIALGTGFSDRSTCKNTEFAKKTKIVSINLNSISKDFEFEIQADVKTFLAKYVKKNFEYKEYDEWEKIINSFNQECINNENTGSKLHSSYVLETLSEFTKKYEPIVVTDVGQHQMLTAQFFNFNKPRKFITSGGLGTMGFGLPAAMGAFVANPNSLVLNITGDGSFQMNLQELATCREHLIPLKIIIMNNGYLGMVRQLQEKIYQNCYQVEMTNPDFTKIAEAYDLFAIRVTKQEELIPALEKAVSYKGTALVDIMIDQFENI